MRLTFQTVLAKIFDFCPFLVPLIAEQRHEKFSLEELTLEIFEGVFVNFNTVFRDLQEVIFGRKSHNYLLFFFGWGLRGLGFGGNWFLLGHVEGLTVVYLFFFVFLWTF